MPLQFGKRLCFGNVFAQKAVVGLFINVFKERTERCLNVANQSEIE
jgi:hypothetical protein